MSNEYRDWLRDQCREVVLDRNLADRITYCDPPFVEGLRNGQPVRFEVWLDQAEWRCERRELER